MKGNFDCRSTGEEKPDTITLSDKDVEQITTQLVPDLKTLQISYEDCEVHILLQNNQLAAVELHCGGNMRMVARDLETHLDAKLRYTEPKEHQIPFYIRQSLRLPAG